MRVLLFSRAHLFYISTAGGFCNRYLSAFQTKEVVRMQENLLYPYDCILVVLSVRHTAYAGRSGGFNGKGGTVRFPGLLLL